MFIWSPSGCRNCVADLFLKFPEDCSTYIYHFLLTFCISPTSRKSSDTSLTVVSVVSPIREDDLTNKGKHALYVVMIVVLNFYNFLFVLLIFVLTNIIIKQDILLDLIWYSWIQLYIFTAFYIFFFMLLLLRWDIFDHVDMFLLVILSFLLSLSYYYCCCYYDNDFDWYYRFHYKYYHLIISLFI